MPNQHPNAAGQPRAVHAQATRAVQRMARAFAREPELIAAWLETTADAAGRERVLKAARRALAHRPRYADLLYHAACAAAACSRLSLAAQMLRRALSINPDYVDALILAGRVALLRGHGAESRAALQAAVDHGGDYPDVHVLLGDAWRKDGCTAAAHAAYAKALTLNADLSTARQGLRALAAAAR